ncbi:MAG: hypothetical protein WCP20_10880 [Desulfuromonadales bacterium]
MSVPKTAQDIADRLKILAGEMEAIGLAMDYYGGFSCWAKHAKEMLGSADMCRDWAFEIEVGE